MYRPQEPEMRLVTEYFSVIWTWWFHNYHHQLCRIRHNCFWTPCVQSDSQNFLRVLTICDIFPVFGVLAPCNLVTRTNLYEECNAFFLQGKVGKILVLSSVYIQEYIISVLSDRKGNTLLVSSVQNQEDTVSICKVTSGTCFLCFEGKISNTCLHNRMRNILPLSSECN